MKECHFIRPCTDNSHCLDATWICGVRKTIRGFFWSMRLCAKVDQLSSSATREGSRSTAVTGLGKAIFLSASSPDQAITCSSTSAAQRGLDALSRDCHTKLNWFSHSSLVLNFFKYSLFRWLHRWLSPVSEGSGVPAISLDSQRRAASLVNFSELESAREFFAVMPSFMQLCTYRYIIYEAVRQNMCEKWKKNHLSLGPVHFRREQQYLIQPRSDPQITCT